MSPQTSPQIPAESAPTRVGGSIPSRATSSTEEEPAGKPGKITHPMAGPWIAEAQLSMKFHGPGKWTDAQLWASYALARLKGGYHHLGSIKECGYTGVQTNVYGTMSTYDFKDLTDAVLIAHEMGVRIEIKSSGPRMLKIYAHTRVSSDDSDLFISERHPTISGLIDRAQEFNPSAAFIYELVDATDEEQFYPMGLFTNFATALREAGEHHPGRWEPMLDTQAVAEIRARKLGITGGDYAVLWRGIWHQDYEAHEWKLVEQQTGTLDKPLPITRE